MPFLCNSFFIFIFLLNLSRVRLISVKRRVFFVALPHEHPQHMPNTKLHQRGCSFVFGVFPSPWNTCPLNHYRHKRGHLVMSKACQFPCHWRCGISPIRLIWPCIHSRRRHVVIPDLAGMLMAIRHIQAKDQESKVFRSSLNFLAVGNGFVPKVRRGSCLGCLARRHCGYEVICVSEPRRRTTPRGLAVHTWRDEEDMKVRSQ